MQLGDQSWREYAAMIRSFADGLRKKLMLRLVVTANGTMPILPSIAT